MEREGAVLKSETKKPLMGLWDLHGTSEKEDALEKFFLAESSPEIE